MLLPGSEFAGMTPDQSVGRIGIHRPCFCLDFFSFYHLLFELPCFSSNLFKRKSEMVSNLHFNHVFFQSTIAHHCFTLPKNSFLMTFVLFDLCWANSFRMTFLANCHHVLSFLCSMLHHFAII